MKKYTAVLLLALILVPACAPEGKAPALTKTEKAANAYVGTYEGILPCADCEGIETELALSPDTTFTLIEYYLTDNAELFLTEGTWRVSDDLKYIILDSSQDEVLNMFYTLKGKDLLKLDMNAKPIESGLNYTLRRQ
jgi:copper homeostasis protein (lipoprotein)